MRKMKKRFIVTPWEVKGEFEEADYARLIKEFGTQKLDDKLIAKLKKYTKDLHYLLRRKIFLSHRNLDWLLDEYAKGNKFFLYTGRGPSGNIHIGHLVPWIFAKWLQDKFNCNLYFQFTDDEKFLFNPKLSLEDTKKYSYENALDVIALGFKKSKTKFIIDTENIKLLYPTALKIAKRLTFSTTKAVFGFNNATNVGSIFFTSVQSAPCFIEDKPCLIPLAIDQDPHFRITRDIAPRIGLRKPAIIHCKFLPGLGKDGKMSASQPETCIFTIDKPSTVKKKIMNAFTGGRESLEKQKQLGGNPAVCSVYSYFFFFDPNDAQVKARYNKCKQGKIFCKQCKAQLVKLVNSFLRKHQKARQAAKKKLSKFLLKD